MASMSLPESACRDLHHCATSFLPGAEGEANAGLGRCFKGALRCLERCQQQLHRPQIRQSATLPSAQHLTQSMRVQILTRLGVLSLMKAKVAEFQGRDGDTFLGNMVIDGPPTKVSTAQQRDVFLSHGMKF